jgi:type I restriction enzyme S subunit
VERHGSKKKYIEPARPQDNGFGNLPEGWTWTTWEQVGFSQNGRFFPSKEYAENGIKLLRPGNLHDSGRILWTTENTKFMPSKWKEEFPEFVVNGSELIMNLTAQSLKDEFLGRICMTSDGEHCLLNQRQARLTPVLGASRFFFWMFKSKIFRDFVAKLNTGSLIQHMFTSQLANFVLPLPPLNEQQRIALALDALMSNIETANTLVTTQYERCRNLRQAVLATAFRGDLLKRGHVSNATDFHPGQESGFRLTSEGEL